MEKLDVKKMSVQDVVKALEDKSISLAEVDKNILKECVVVMKSWGYRNAEISSLLKISDRSVQRYISDIRESNSLTASSDFQAQFMAEAISNLRAQYYRLIRLSHLEDATTLEKTKTIFAACQVLRDQIVILERLGYVSIENTLKVKAEREECMTKLNTLIRESVPDHDMLTDDQKKVMEGRVIKHIRHTNAIFAKLANDFIADNKKNGIVSESVMKAALSGGVPVVPDNNKKS